MKAMVTATVAAKGTPQASKRVTCSTSATRYSRAAEPMLRESRKKPAPVR